MTEADPDDIGPDGTVRLRCYLPMGEFGLALGRLLQSMVTSGSKMSLTG
jgi:hypothetical protein